MENLSDEMILEICTNMSNEELSHFLQSNTKYYNICKEILDKREEQEYFSTLDEDIDNLSIQVFREIKNKAQIIQDEFWSLEGSARREHVENIRNLYVRGNIYRAILIFQRQIYKYEMVNVILEIIEELIYRQKKEYSSIEEITDMVKNDFTNKDEWYYLEKNDGPIIL